MISRSMTRGLMMAALALMVSAGCEQADRAVSPVTTQSAVVVSDNQQYTLVEGTLPAGLPALEVSQLIGVTGGTLSLAGHSIVVPAGAVTQPTLFTMTLGLNGYVEVELEATRVGLFGNIIDVGSGGFANG